MAKRKYEFRPDRSQTSFFSRLIPTPKQRSQLLKWSLYSLLLLALSLLQDVVLCRVKILGATTELVPCAIMLITILEGTQSGSIFCLVATALYIFSGSAPGYYVLPGVTILALALTMLRQSYLSPSFGTAMACLIPGVLLYEMLVFVVELVFGNTTAARFMAFWLKGWLSLAAAPLIYPIAAAIKKTGGEPWKE